MNTTNAIKNAPTKAKWFALFIILFAGIGGILYGYDIGIIAGALIFMKSEIALTTFQTSLLVAAVLGGGSIAILIAGPLADKVGRRRMISIAAIMFILGIIVLVSSNSFAGIFTGRLIEGIGVGIITVIIPLYLAEAAPAAIRGSSVTAFQLFLTSGILLAYVVALAFAHSGNWRGMFMCSLIPGALLLIGSFLIFESPRWLFFQGRKEETLKVLQKSRSQQETEHDLYMMTQLEIEIQSAKKSPAHKKATTLWQKRYIFPFCIALAIAIFTQLTGINVFLQLCTLILQRAGLHSNITSMIGSVGIGLINCLITVIAVCIIDRVGRKPLVILGTAGITLSLCYLGFVQYLLQPSVLQGYLTAIGFLFFVMFYAIGPGVVVWLAISELMPMRIRSKGMAICLFGNSIASALLAGVFLNLANYLGYAGVFWMCGGFTLLYFLTVTFFLPETKNKSLEEIEQHFAGLNLAPSAES